MKTYQIRENLIPCEPEEIRSWQYPYVAVASREEFEAEGNFFDMGVDLDIDYELEGISRARVNYDSITGHLSIPSRTSSDNPWSTFVFAIDEKGIVFINDDGTAQKIIRNVQLSKRWKMPSIERFIYDFLENIVNGDLLVLERYDKQMDAMEDRILDGNLRDIMEELTEIRSEIMDLRTHYEQLIDLGQELEENENNFFAEDNLRFFHLFIERVERLQGIVMSLRDHTMQVRDLYNAQLDVRQNQNMAYLTVVMTVFTPLTLITGWFGMNFSNMYVLDKPWAYPVLIGICVLIVIITIIFFKKKKWL